ncbi:MAG TPA: histone deacetylase family protein [Candidatus Eisenbacteria bacterium]|nr:histone deacetylase family protein [Candidatus Eisenbacteria bacterium]
MIAFVSPTHVMHAPEYEFHRGERVPCFETPKRAEIVHAELTARGHEIRMPTHSSSGLLPRVHSERYLSFLESAWDQWVAMDPANGRVQPFPAVWPVRTLRTDLEPDNFTARLGLYSMDNESPFVKGTWIAAKEAADAVVSAVAFLQETGARAVFSATRPPGHHAGPDFMGGYCFLNNAAVAAEALRSRDYLHVAILDVDYHHGNGTQAIFYHRSDVLTVSVHGDPRTEYPFFLGHSDETGEDDGDGFNLNLPLPAGTPTGEWFEALDFARDRIRHHRPNALVVSLGLDTYEKDPISTFKLRSVDFTLLGERVAELDLPTVFVLEGGYATEELGVNACNVLEGFEAR